MSLRRGADEDHRKCGSRRGDCAQHPPCTHRHYSLLRDALAKSGRVGIATFVMREREHLAVLRPEGRGIMLTTMRFADEIRSAEDLALPAEGEHPKKEMDLALQLVDALADDWDPAEYHDTYRETLRGVNSRKRGHARRPPPKRPRHHNGGEQEADGPPPEESRQYFTDR